jgi:hypothetical protein
MAEVLHTGNIADLEPPSLQQIPSALSSQIPSVTPVRAVWPILKKLPWAANTILLLPRPLVELSEPFLKVR